MDKHIFDTDTGKLLRVEKIEPRCGHDFCNLCGECLYCFGDEPCYGNTEDTPPMHYYSEFVKVEARAVAV